MSEMNVELVAIIVGVLTLIIGVFDSVRSHRQAIKAQKLQIILGLSESFMNKWESKWSMVLEELDQVQTDGMPRVIPEEYRLSIRYMLNWIDWLGAIKSSKTLEDIGIVTSSIGVTIKRMLDAGHAIVRDDCEKHGSAYWQNLFVVAKDLDVSWAIELEKEFAE